MFRTTRRYHCASNPASASAMPWSMGRRSFARTPEFGICHASMRICWEGHVLRRVPGAPPDAPCGNWLKGQPFRIFGPVRQSLVRCESKRARHALGCDSGERVARQRRNRQRLCPALFHRPPSLYGRCSKTRHSGAGWTSAAEPAGRSSYSSARPAMLKCRPLGLANSACGGAGMDGARGKPAIAERTGLDSSENPHLIIYSDAGRVNRLWYRASNQRGLEGEYSF